MPRPALRAAADDLSEALIHHAARLAAAERDGSTNQIAGLLELVPDGRLDLLARVLARMVDPDRTVTELLAWTGQPVTPPQGARPLVVSSGRLRAGRRPYPREHGTERGYKQHDHRGEVKCAPCLAAHAVHQRPQACRDEFARLRALGVDWSRAAELSRPSVVLPRHTEPAAVAAAAA